MRWINKSAVCVLFTLCCCLAACGQREESGDILFVNCTDTPVHSVQIKWENETLVGQYANGTAIEKYNNISFDLDSVPATVSACGEDGEELASCRLTERAQNGWCLQLTDRSDGRFLLEARELLSSKQNSPYVIGTEQTWRGVVTERCMDKVRAVDSTWGFLVPSRAVIGIDITEGTGKSFWESEQYKFPMGIALGDYVEITSAVEKHSGLLVATKITILEKQVDTN